MGWGYGVIGDQEVGYSVPDVCWHPECQREIDRGIAHACGGFPGEGEFSCKGFFCADHLYVARPCVDGKVRTLCGACTGTQERLIRDRAVELGVDPDEFLEEILDKGPIAR